MAKAADRKPEGRTAQSLRRRPAQQRSRERVERILAVASQKIAESGSDALRMSEVAAEAGISIGSLYQYFPDKAAIIHTLAARYNALCRAAIEEGLAPVKDLKSLCAAFDALAAAYYDLFLAEPVIRDIWSGALADGRLRDLELEHSRVIGKMMTETLMRLFPKADRDEVAARSLLVMHLGEATMRLAVSVKRKEGDALVEAYKSMAGREFTAIAARAKKG
ncbi:TetR family transcriptional regulator [Pelagibius sp. 7325]|uniref:TetR family transcriptional regulator n=1 Tax=Pelagibius sp. 7325 TaxID=3131994 RepID=UPI0030EBDB1F